MDNVRWIREVGGYCKELGRFIRLLCHSKFHPLLYWLFAKTQYTLLTQGIEVVTEKLIVREVISLEAGQLSVALRLPRNLWFESWQGKYSFLFAKASRPALGPSQPQIDSGDYFAGGIATGGSRSPLTHICCRDYGVISPFGPNRQEVTGDWK